MSMTDDQQSQDPGSPPPSPEPDRRQHRRSQWALVSIILALAVASVFFRVLVMNHLDESAFLFVGLPAILAIMLSFTPRAKSVTGMAMKGITIGLLMAGVFFAEAFVCIAFAAPIFYLVGGITGWLIDRDRRRKREGGGRLYSIALIPLLMMSLEGVIPGLSFPSDITVTRTKTVDAAPADVETKLAQAPLFSRRLPSLLAFSFPRPVGANGTGSQPGDRRVVDYADGKSLVVVVQERGPGHVVFKPIQDTSPISHWLTWTASDVRWRDAGNGRTEVTWTLHFQRRLAPAWYFGPLETFGASETAGYLIDALATP
jgi:hypothetical protein